MGALDSIAKWIESLMGHGRCNASYKPRTAWTWHVWICPEFFRNDYNEDLDKGLSKVDKGPLTYKICPNNFLVSCLVCPFKISLACQIWATSMTQLSLKQTNIITILWALTIVINCHSDPYPFWIDGRIVLEECSHAISGIIGSAVCCYIIR